MNYFLAAICILLTVCCAWAQEKTEKELTVVPSVDLNRYAGTWYEIARLPNWFQKKCSQNVTATYVLQDDGTIQLINRCQNKDGEVEEVEGVAKLDNSDSSRAKLKVRFAPRFLSWLPFVWGKYWIIDLGADYDYAVVGEPGRKYLWILSRTPVLDEAKLQAILERIKAQGYDLTNLLRTKQSEDGK